MLATDCDPYILISFIGEWTSGDLAFPLVIQSVNSPTCFMVYVVNGY